MFSKVKNVAASHSIVNLKMYAHNTMKYIIFFFFFYQILIKIKLTSPLVHETISCPTGNFIGGKFHIQLEFYIVQGIQLKRAVFNSWSRYFN